MPSCTITARAGTPSPHVHTLMNLEHPLHTPCHRNPHPHSSSMLRTAFFLCSLNPCPMYFLSAVHSLLTHPIPCTLSIPINTYPCPHTLPIHPMPQSHSHCPHLTTLHTLALHPMHIHPTPRHWVYTQALGLRTVIPSTLHTCSRSPFTLSLHSMHTHPTVHTHPMPCNHT